MWTTALFKRVTFAEREVRVSWCSPIWVRSEVIGLWLGLRLLLLLLPLASTCSMTGVSTPVVYTLRNNTWVSSLRNLAPGSAGPSYGAGQNVPCGDGHALLPSETDKILVELDVVGWLLCFVFSF